MGEPATIPALLVALPLLAAAVVRLPGIADRVVADVVGIGAAVACGALALLLLPTALDRPVVHVVGGWEPRAGLAIGIPLVADALATGFVALAGILVAAALAYLTVSHERRPASLVLTLLLLGAFTGFVLAGDLLTMFVFLELFGVAVYAITAGKVEDPAALPAAINLAVVSTAGAVLFLMGAGLLYRITGTPNLAQAGQRLADAEPDAAVAVAIVLLLGGLAVKAGLVPFHFAHVDLHTANWSPHAGLFGGLMLPVALYGIARVHTTALWDLAGATALVGPTLLTVAVGTALVAGAMSLMQDQIKRLLAFSSVAHLGIAAMALGLFSPEGVASAGIYLVGHGLVKVALLMTAGVVLHRLGSLHVGELAGQGRSVPAATALLAAGAPLLAGLPPSGLFAGKAGFADAAAAAGLPWLVPAAYLAALLTGAALARAVVHLWWGWPVPADPIGRVAEHDPDELFATSPRTLVAVPAGLLVAGLAVPLLPGVVAGAGRAGVMFLDRVGYEAAVLGGATAAAPVAAGATALDPWTASSLVLAAVVSVGAVGVGVVVAGAWRRGSGALGAPLRWLRLLHSGLTNDQMTWVTVAMAAWCVVGLVRLAG